MSFIGIDWGTSRLRAYLLDAAGACLDRRANDCGLTNVGPHQFQDILDRTISDWPSQAPILLCGMVGSRQGWQEVPYIPCPAGLDNIVAGILPVQHTQGRIVKIVPGLSTRESSNVPDVMRGEETQLIGALMIEPKMSFFILPGTHSKHVWLQDNRILSFTTHMTGEIFALLKAHSLLGRAMQDGPFNAAIFHEGCRRAQDDNGLLHHIFGVRGRFLFNELSETTMADYLSGLLIGHELKNSNLPSQIGLIGEPALCMRYAEVLKTLGRSPSILPPDLAMHGLAQIAQRSALI